jgi:hypothetical protein
MLEKVLIVKCNLSLDHFQRSACNNSSELDDHIFILLQQVANDVRPKVHLLLEYPRSTGAIRLLM